MQKRIYLNDDWRFTETFLPELCDKEYDASQLQKVRIPHTCKETPFHYFNETMYEMECGYRKELFVPEEWRNQQILLTFDGIAHVSEVYLNGVKVGEHNCGYTGFTIDLTNQVIFGENNVLVVKVDSHENQNIPPFGYVIDYMTYGGIYRDVYLEVKNQVYLEDVFVKTKLFYEKQKENHLTDAQLIAEVKINHLEAVREKDISSSMNKEKYQLRQRLRNCTTQKEIQLEEAEVKHVLVSLNSTVCDVLLWSIKTPNLYELIVELCCGKKIVDVKVIRFGFREAIFQTDGFYLNGNKVKLFGLNRHQSYPYVGYAMPASMQRLDADILKNELGCNAVRTSHYPQSHDFLNRCDEIGLLVFTEIPGWQHIGDKTWKQQAIENVKDMVLQYRNHTSIILWGVRINESKDDDEFYRITNEAAHKLDDSRATGGVRAHRKSSLLEDVYTYNDFLHDGKTKGCSPKKAITSDVSKSYLISEYNGHMYPTKNFDSEEHRLEHALRHTNVLDEVAKQTDIAGSFGWCMFDYNTHKDFGSGDRICYHGVLDMFRNHKLAASIYASQQEKIPVLELSSSMDIGEHPACNRGATYMFTNADSVKMYKNGTFIKEYNRQDSPYQNIEHGPILLDDFIGNEIQKQEHFTKSQAEAVKKILNATARFGLSHLPMRIKLLALKLMICYRMTPTQAVALYNKYIGDWGGESTIYRFEAIKDGKVVKTRVKEPMTKVHLELMVDHTNLVEHHSYDVALVRIRACDQNGNVLSFYHEPIHCEVVGPIEIIGPKVIALQGGMGGVYVKTIGQTGTAILNVCMQDGKQVKVDFHISDRELSYTEHLI